MGPGWKDADQQQNQDDEQDGSHCSAPGKGVISRYRPHHKGGAYVQASGRGRENGAAQTHRETGQANGCITRQVRPPCEPDVFLSRPASFMRLESMLREPDLRSVRYRTKTVILKILFFERAPDGVMQPHQPSFCGVVRMIEADQRGRDSGVFRQSSSSNSGSAPVRSELSFVAGWVHCLQ